MDKHLSFVLNKIRQTYKPEGDFEYWIATPLLSSEKEMAPDNVDEMEAINKLVELGAVKIQEPNGRKEEKRILDIGYTPPESRSIKVLYLEILQPKFYEVYSEENL